MSIDDDFLLRFLMDKPEGTLSQQDVEKYFQRHELIPA